MNRLILNTVGGEPGEIVSLDQTADSGTVGAGEVRVAVEAAPINPGDLLFQQGWFGVYPRVPQPVGAEGVGRVVAVGQGVDPALQGRRVLLLPTFVNGTWGDETVIPAGRVIPVTDNADPRLLAQLPVNAGTAYALLHDFVTLAPGDWIGVDLANSGVGQFLVQLAHRAGLKTLAIVRREDAAEQVRRLGADAVLLDGDGLGERITGVLGDDQLKVYFEGTGSSAKLAEVTPRIAYGGSVVVFSSATGQTVGVPIADLFYRRVSLRSFYILAFVTDTPHERLERIYGELGDLVAKRELSAPVEAEYGLADYKDALAHAARPERSGKVLFVPAR